MAISTGTLLTKTIPLNQASFILHLRLRSDGDASGGGGNVATDIAPFIPINTVASVLHVTCRNSDANMIMSQHLYDGGATGPTPPFSVPITSPLIGYNSGNAKTTPINGANYYSIGDESSFYNLPLFLGEAKTSNIYWYCEWATNTNLKTYIFELILLISSKQSQIGIPLSPPILAPTNQPQPGSIEIGKTGYVPPPFAPGTPGTTF